MIAIDKVTISPLYPFERIDVNGVIKLSVSFFLSTESTPYFRHLDISFFSCVFTSDVSANSVTQGKDHKEHPPSFI